LVFGGRPPLFLLHSIRHCFRVMEDLQIYKAKNNISKLENRMDAKAAVLCQVRKGNCETTSDSIYAFNLNTSISFGTETRKHRNSFKKKRRAFSLAVCVAAQSWFEFHKLEFFHMTLSEENIRC